MVMKAAVLEQWKQLQVREVDVPDIASGEVLVQVSRAGICGSDVHIFNGDNPIATTPVIPGHEFMGTIVEKASDVTGFCRDQRVVIQPLKFCGSCTPCRKGIPHVCEQLTVVGVNGNGGFAEYACVTSDMVFELPQDLPDDVAVLAEPFSIGYHCCQRGQLTDTDRVLVIGAGPIGFYAALIARELGATDVILSEPQAERRAFTQAFKLPSIDPLPDSAVTDLQDRSNGEGYDLVIETSGTAAGLDFASQAATVQGRIVTLGFPAKNYADYNITRGIVRELSLIGSRVCTRSQFASTLQLLTNMYRRGEYDLGNLVTTPRGLADLSQSIEDVRSGAVCAKILVTPV